MKLIKIISYRIFGKVPKDGSLNEYISRLTPDRKEKSLLSLHMEKASKTYEY